ncbi:hypothetical protein B0T10DRAFT_417778 [Thelonectria olida]|uniref:chitinase n=1 Tax=Thelonectria olida TaxID=1576542 RepID=A0A9P8VSU4_9HYPO|nr:hypothetical protein B0T10DRAFT_417778 [Thelonectria olida]
MAGILSPQARYGALAILLSFLLAFSFFHTSSQDAGHLTKRVDWSDLGFSPRETGGHPAGNCSLFSRADDDPYACNKKKPCSNGACCGKSGVCGYGPDYCGKGCTSNCDAKAQCGKYAAKGETKCPLNVCCSEFGFCGTTSEFCNSKCQSNCGQPSVPSGKSAHPVREKVIAYYEAWADRRSCRPFSPSQIPTSALTHVNFAFAYIDPDTFEVTTMDSKTPADLFQEVTAIKSMKSGLGDPVEVWVAIGGWTFSNNDTDTQPLLGKIAKSSDNREKFAKNLIAFMTLYGFDGVDLDWEYPGAPDRGGKEEDTKNYVKLISSLSKAFKASSRGGYGLSFTIPSSYWYLRWFDVPAMLDAGASWVNLMSYDLHGVWDKHNAIGSIVQAHTNLTEIKESVALLWRNDVPPGKVVLGTGFYGRSFELAKSSCNKPGCTFSGAARKGKCTAEAGILGYFEIQDILKNEKVKKVHDKEAAVNYITFDDDQWVSYDDNTTFSQKVKWADSVGLGGLMIWAIDLDDDDFTALSGLVGKEVGESLSIDKGDTVSKRTGDSWSSDSGQDCYATSCGDDCKSSESTLEEYSSTCGGGKKKKICCPRARTPRSCQWRGGESGSACHGQCHEAELSIVRDKHGSLTCSSGKQVYCCTSERYQEVLEGCSMGKCSGDCPDGTYEVAKQSCGTNGKKKPWCCKLDLQNCHWVGKGSCDDNNCENSDLQLSRSNRGGGKWACGVTGRKKSLCCNAPNDIDPYTPVDLKYLFPDPPAADDTIKFDLQVLGGFGGSGAGSTKDTSIKDPASGVFGFVLIAGPKDSVSSIDKRDGSHVEVVDCASIQSSERQTTRIICTNDGADSNCDDMLEGGLDGTILRMPDECGPGTYVVAHSLRRSDNQTLPTHLCERMAASKEVMDLEFSYEFQNVKRGTDDIYFRADYSNIAGYWDTIVDQPGITGKRSRSLHPRNIAQRDLDKRFFADDSADWANRFEELRSRKYYTDFSESAESTIIHSKLDCGHGGWLTIESAGEVSVQAKFGYTLIGTLSPFSITQSYGFNDLKYELDVDVTVSGKSGLDTEYISRPERNTPQTGTFFTHPGLLSFSPSFDIEIGLQADNASFSG